MSKKESFLIYKEFYPAIENLSDEQLGRLFRSIFIFQRENVEPNDDDILMPFQFFKNQFRIDDDKYKKIVERNKLNGSKGGRKKNPVEPKKPSGLSGNPKNPTGADNENEKDNEKDIISFDRFWNLYDKKVGRKDKIESKWNKLSNQTRKAIIEYIPKYIDSQPDKKYRKNPETFLNNKSWNDEIILNDQEKNSTKGATGGTPFNPYDLLPRN